MLQKTVDVIIVGCGPVGAMAANLLGQRGISTLVVERELSAHGQSRAISVDDEAQRIFQAAGLEGELGVGFHPCKRLQYLDDDLRVLAEVDFTKLDEPNGHPVGALFQQPRMEEALRRGMARFAHVELWRGHLVESFVQGDGGLTAHVRDVITSRTTLVRAKYLLGADGAHSAIRRMLGLKLEGSTGLEHALAITVGTSSPEPDFSCYLCGPARRGFVTRTAKDEMRFDIMVPAGVDLDAVRQPESVRALIAPYIDLSTVEVRSANVYSYHSRIVSHWRVGRVFLLGDAAHLMPPFLGQGLCAGLRDALNLAWKLASVLAGAAAESLLETYEVERRDHVEALIRSSDAMGRVMMSGGALVSRLRNLLIQVLYRLPFTGPFIREFRARPVVPLRRGFLLGGVRAKDGVEGTLFPQPRVEVSDGTLARLDDVLGPGFVLLTRPGASRELRTEARTLAESLGMGAWSVLPAPHAGFASSNAVVDVGGRLGDWFLRHAVDVVVLRPDRHVYGAVSATRFAALQRSLKGHLRPRQGTGERDVRRAG
ncbi:bifunctional 3-(3-hydroxy-phenyl)propionate/3-hydroxycinnamic acid hydroxylase [Myxococcus sp. K15C18031901]|nr:bifunctional 3-(3-hydroxy-phenyl)propionate/3-hydroxycinnamic acid hydroxylase [Myxococcus dinghuensis]MCP3099571.1 bifunctional 3-(3-hydroxy-phenyl)propionate/3-hydroxycinnamic acid hydroxylase [Myxococcus dinghuensis]